MNSIPTCASISLVCLLLAASCSKEAEPTSPPSAAPPKSAPVAPLLQKKEIADWCVEHVVPESICTRCNDSLIADFKAKGDWCSSHGLPESQCVTCKPELKAKFEAMAPKSKD